VFEHFTGEVLSLVKRLAGNPGGFKGGVTVFAIVGRREKNRDRLTLSVWYLFLT